jgi:hypothetical protein
MSDVVGRPEVGELGEQIVVRAYPVLCHLPICEDRQEVILDVVGECPAIFREGRRARGVKGHEVRQQCPCHAWCFLRGIPTRVLQRVREDDDKTPGRTLKATVRHLLASSVQSLTDPRRERGCMIQSGMIAAHPKYQELVRELADRRSQIRDAIRAGV